MDHLPQMAEARIWEKRNHRLFSESPVPLPGQDIYIPNGKSKFIEFP